MNLVNSFHRNMNDLFSLGFEIQNIDNKNCNTFLENGIFVGKNLINSPEKNTYSELIVMRHNKNWIVQQCRVDLRYTYIRAYLYPKWSNWVRIDSNGECEKYHIVQEQINILSDKINSLETRLNNYKIISNNVYVTIDGNEYTLQEAIDNHLICKCTGQKSTEKSAICGTFKAGTLKVGENIRRK